MDVIGKLRRLAIGAVSGVVAMAVANTAQAWEGGLPAETKAGTFIGASAGAPPPGLYGFTQAFTYNGNFTGPVTNIIGNNVGVQANVGAQGFLYVPGWTFLGATYDAVLVLVGGSQSVGRPLNIQEVGAIDTYFVPVELSWNLGNSGFFVKTGVGIWAPTGTQTGVNKLGNVGLPFWTIQPELVFSYLKDGWNLSVALYDEIHTENSLTHYRSGDVFHADFTATKRFDKWTIGPVGYYVGQITNDRSSAFYNNLMQNGRYDIWAAGGLIGYDFGPASVSLWGAQEVYSRASGGAAVGPFNTAASTKGFTLFGQLSYRIWGPEQEAAPKRPMFHK